MVKICKVQICHIKYDKNVLKIQELMGKTTKQ